MGNCVCPKAKILHQIASGKQFLFGAVAIF